MDAPRKNFKLFFAFAQKKTFIPISDRKIRDKFPCRAFFSPKTTTLIGSEKPCRLLSLI